MDLSGNRILRMTATAWVLAMAAAFVFHALTPDRPWVDTSTVGAEPNFSETSESHPLAARLAKPMAKLLPVYRGLAPAPSGASVRMPVEDRGDQPGALEPRDTSRGRAPPPAAV